MNYCSFICFDLETTDSNPEKCQPVQIAAVAVHSRTLEVIPGSEFETLIKPLYGAEAETLNLTELQDGAVKVHGKTKEMLETAPDLESVLKNFSDYVNKYNYKKTAWTKPIAVSYNGIGFDHVILDREFNRFGIDNPFHKVYKVDMLHHMFALFDNDKKVKSLSMDNLYRKYFGYKDTAHGAHDALGDVLLLHEAFKRYFRLIRKLNRTTKFEGSMS